jgi:hypothetical protein
VNSGVTHLDCRHLVVNNDHNNIFVSLAENGRFGSDGGVRVS